jgi:hypothetical protein
MDMVHITYRSGMEANASISIHKKMLEDSRIDSYRMFIVVGKFDGGRARTGAGVGGTGWP